MAWDLSIICRYISNSFQKQFFSLDDPSGSGDHENIYGSAQDYFEKIYDSNGKVFSGCVKKAVNIREIQSHIPWHSLSNNPIVFSDLDAKNTKFSEMTESDLVEVRNSIRYTKAVNPSYGWDCHFLVNDSSIFSIHCFNQNATTPVINCADMEISYYFECSSYLGDYGPSLLVEDLLSADFTLEKG